MHIFQRISSKLITILAAGALVLAAILLVPSPAPAEPVIAWTPSSVSQAILAGESITVAVSFTASENLNNVDVRVVPALEPYVQTNPALR